MTFQPVIAARSPASGPSSAGCPGLVASIAVMVDSSDSIWKFQ